MLARLGFSVATQIDPDLLFVDEILAVGDESFQCKCLERMNNFRRQGKTTIFVSHDMGLVQSLCDRVLLIDHGHLYAEAPPKRVIAHSHELLHHPTAAPTG